MFEAINSSHYSAVVSDQVSLSPTAGTLSHHLWLPTQLLESPGPAAQSLLRAFLC